MRQSQEGSGKVAAMRAAREAQYAVAHKAQKVAVTAPLTDADRVDLERLEGMVSRGYGTFMEVGAALAEIKERRLYRETHGTFEVYCRERWQMGKNYADKNIRAAHAVAELGTGTRYPLPETERIARPLTSLPLKERRTAWKKAVKAADGRPVTPDAVEEAVREVTGEPEHEPEPRPVCPTCGRPLPKGKG